MLMFFFSVFQKSGVILQSCKYGTLIAQDSKKFSQFSAFWAKCQLGNTASVKQWGAQSVVQCSAQVVLKQSTWAEWETVKRHKK
jgi:hypothetical protein